MHDLTIASLRRRSLAVLVDSCVLMAAWFAALAIIWLITGADADFWTRRFEIPTDESTSGDLLAAAGTALLLLVIWTGYTGLLTSRADDWNGQTLGKRAAQLRIVTTAGQPISASTAWKRVALSAVLLGAGGVIGPLVGALGGGASASNAGTYISYAALAVVVLFTLRGGLRQAAYDVVASTLVVDVPASTPAFAAAPASPDAGAASPPAVTFTQPAAEPALKPTITPRPKTAMTWVGVLATALGALALIPLTTLDLPEDRSEEILALPETKEVLARVRTVETLVGACLASGQAAEACDEAAELKADAVEFVDGFDLTVDAVGAHAGKVGLFADDDKTVIVYGFTGVDRVWVSFVERDDVEHTCVKHTSDDLCDGVYDW